MLTNYISAAMQKATYRLSPDEHLIYGEIPGFDRVTASAETIEVCHSELVEALEEWILFHISRQLPVPIVDGIELPSREIY
ncbi:MAG: type II toxin-antitoxin system HicB family antitoxin [Thermosynechococcaceae cyanobacterium]